MGEIILEKDPVRFRHELKQMINRGDDHILASPGIIFSAGMATAGRRDIGDQPVF